MKKGRRQPKARARWILGATSDQDFAPPVWVHIQALFAVYIKLISGLPVPLTVQEFETNLGQWRYDPSDAAIVWHGTWDNSFDDGDWYLRQYDIGTEFTQRVFTMTINRDDLTPKFDLRNGVAVDHGEWRELVPELPRCDIPIAFDLPWITCPIAVFRAASYDEIRTAGIDPDDTAPVTWAYDQFP